MTTRPKSPRPSVQKIPAVTELPVTRAMLYAVRDELASRLDAHSARFDQVDARFDRVDARFAEIDARFAEIDARFDRVDARFEQVHAELREMRAEMTAFKAEVRAGIARVTTLVEEQNARNQVVLEVVNGFNARFDRIEAELAENREMFREIMKAVTKRP